jgi:polysaccharide chain length determinant protein (PEP-CTERM system associated)
MRSDITIELIKPAGQSEVSAFKIAYSASNPGLAQKVTGQLSSLFIQDSLRDQQQLSEDTAQSLDSQFSAAQKDLQQQERQLSDFQKQFLGELPEQMAGNVQILSGLQNRLGAATAALHQAEQQNLYLASMLGASLAPGDSSPAGIASPLDVQIEKMKDDLANMSPHYTPQHPDVVHLKEKIANAEKARQHAETAPGARGEESGGVRTARRASPGSQLESQFKANELEIQNRKQEVKDLEQQVSQYQSRLNMTPLRQQQLAEVTRNHEQSQANYAQLVAKKQQSSAATDLAKRRQDAQFRMIDPPSLPQAPYWPNRIRFSAMGLLAGLFLGLAAISLIEMADARIHSEDDLKLWAAVPVIGTVPPLMTAAEMKHLPWRRGVEIALAALLVALVPVLTFMAYLKG